LKEKTIRKSLRRDWRSTSVKFSQDYLKIWALRQQRPTQKWWGGAAAPPKYERQFDGFLD
jgi:hypothetical protein